MVQSFYNYLKLNANLSDAELTSLTYGLEKRLVKKGDYLLKVGQVCEYNFYVEQGLLRSYTIDTHGKEHLIQFAPEGWIISDRSSSFFQEQSQLYIDAIEDSEVILLQDSFFEQISCMSEKFAKNNTIALHNHIRNLQNRVNMLLGASAQERYLEFIKMYPNILLRVPQWMVASYLGITPESLSRVRKELAQKNFK